MSNSPTHAHIVTITMINANHEAETACRSCYDGWTDYDDMVEEARDEVMDRFDNLSPEAGPVRFIIQKLHMPLPVYQEIVAEVTVPDQVEGQTTTATTTFA